MTEIKIEKKKPVWPWILALLVVAAVVFFVFFWDKEPVQDVIQENTETTTATTDQTTTTPNSAVTAYVDFIRGSEQNMELDHEFSNEALTKLIAATESKAADLNYDISANMSQVREHAQHITEDPYETTHANSISQAAVTLGGTLQGMQQQAYPELADQADRVNAAANAIDPNQLTLDQKDAVKTFFNEAAVLLENMNQ